MLRYSFPFKRWSAASSFSDNKRLTSNEPRVVIVFAIIDKGIILQLFQSSYEKQSFFKVRSHALAWQNHLQGDQLQFTWIQNQIKTFGANIDDIVKTLIS